MRAVKSEMIIFLLMYTLYLVPRDKIALVRAWVLARTAADLQNFLSGLARTISAKSALTATAKITFSRSLMCECCTDRLNVLVIT